MPTLKEKLRDRFKPKNASGKLSDEQVREAVRRFADGESAAALGEELGVSGNTILYHARKAARG